MKPILLIILLMSLGSCASIKPNIPQPEKYCGVVTCYTIKKVSKL